jgi:hypothetical protein
LIGLEKSDNGLRVVSHQEKGEVFFSFLKSERLKINIRNHFFSFFPSNETKAFFFFNARAIHLFRSSNRLAASSRQS